MKSTSDNTVIVTDSCADLPNYYIETYKLKIIPMYYRFENNIYGDKYNILSSKCFYNKLRNGEMPYTLCSDLNIVKNTFEKLFKKFDNIIYICFSSGLSSSYSNTLILKEELKEKYPNENIYVLDSLTGSLGEGLMVIKALKLKLKGNNYKDIIEYLENTKQLYQSEFVVNDLNHLKRGGRLSSTSTFVGGILNIKPLVHTDIEGKVSMVTKYRGINNAIECLANRVVEQADFEEPIGIIHADNSDIAYNLKSKIEKLKELKELIITPLTPTIGAHLGADSVGVSYVKKIK